MSGRRHGLMMLLGALVYLVFGMLFVVNETPWQWLFFAIDLGGAFLAGWHWVGWRDERRERRRQNGAVL